ncbi:MAG TPA: response regulator [Cyclobacteriaceae bacterium]|nr:response regulator [Cyclobacteriaceae bacterium]
MAFPAVNKLKPVNVLVVEDNPDDSELTLFAIKKGNKNANVIHLRDGSEVLDFMTRTDKLESVASNIKFILLNLSIPKIDGLEILKKIRENEHTQFIPVIIFSSSEEGRKINQAYELGANSYVVKPARYENYVDEVSLMSFYWSTINNTTT